MGKIIITKRHVKCFSYKPSKSDKLKCWCDWHIGLPPYKPAGMAIQSLNDSKIDVWNNSLPLDSVAKSISTLINDMKGYNLRMSKADLWQRLNMVEYDLENIHSGLQDAIRARKYATYARENLPALPQTH